jgi:hypothetical protein
VGIADSKVGVLVKTWPRHIAAFCLAGMAVTDLARAQSSLPVSWLYPYVDYAQSVDSNVFRVPDDNAGPTRPDLSDSFRTATTGLVIQRNIGRQVLNARMNFARTHFDRFTFLDNDSRDVQANWNWRLGSTWSGNIATSSAKTLTPFTEQHDQERNLRTQKRDSVDIKWDLLSHWDIQAMSVKSHQGFDLLSQKSRNRNLQEHQIAINYWGRKPSRIGLSLNRKQAQFPNISQDLVGRDLPLGFYNYDHLEAQILVDWYSLSKSSLHFRGGHTRRKHDLFPIRDFSGNHASLRGTWEVTSRITLRGQVYREIGSIDNLINSYTLNRGRTMSWQWVPAPKLRIDGNIRIESRDFLGVVEREVLQKEQSRTITLGLTYTPWQHVQLGLSSNFEQLRSNLARRAYRANGMNANVRYQF